MYITFLVKQNIKRNENIKLTIFNELLSTIEKFMKIFFNYIILKLTHAITNVLHRLILTH